MVDDQTKTTGETGAASNGGFKPTTPVQSGNAQKVDNAEPEARILEEIIVRPASTAAKPLQPSIPMPPKVVVPTANTLPKEMPVVTPPTVTVPATTFGSFAPNTIGAMPEKKIPLPPTPEITMAPPVPPPPVMVPPIKIGETPMTAPEVKPVADMGSILKGIKLPERRVVPGSETPKEKTITYDTSLAAVLSDENKKDVETAEPAAEATKTPAGPTTSIVTPLRTLKNDFQDIVRDKKISLVRAASMEQDKKRGATRLSEEIEVKGHRSHRTVKIVAVIFLFVFLGIAIFIGIALIQAERSGVVNTPSDTSLLFAESSAPLPLENLSSFDVKSLLAQMRGVNSALGSITRIVPTVRVADAPSASAGVREATLEEFLSALGARASSNLVRALSDEFFFGIHTVDKNAPVFVIPVVSYERAFAGMLEWESTMNADLAPAFTSVPATIVGQNGLLERRPFEDLIMRNYDTRALKDNSETIQLFYAFPTRNILIIAESPYSFVEILARLRAERKL